MALTEKALEVGDTVVLKSNGPEMTICGIGCGNIVFAMWFDDSGDIKEHEFYTQCLRKTN